MRQGQYKLILSIIIVIFGGVEWMMFGSDWPYIDKTVQFLEPPCDRLVKDLGNLLSNTKNE